MSRELSSEGGGFVFVVGGNREKFPGVPLQP
jgi:hypothetical protein